MRYLFILIPIFFLATGCSSSKGKKDYVFSNADGKAKYLQSYNNTIQKLWGIPFEEIDVKTTFGIAHVIVSGPTSGEPVILFHGMDASSSMWFPNVGALSKDYRVYGIDFPLEAGKSVASQNRLSNNQIVQFYNEVFTHFKMKNINLMGASRGGWMAANLAIQQRNRVKKLVLLSPAQTFRGMKQPLKVLTAVKLKIKPNRKRLARFFDTFSLYPDKIDDAYKEQFYLANKYGDSKPRYIKMLKFSKKELNSLQIPVLVLVGDHDIVNDEKTLVRAQQLIPKAQTMLIRNAGHFLSIDQSAIVNARIVDFLNQK
jgi:pimeloyl-ACP methyl ester carboxylesterase